MKHLINREKYINEYLRVSEKSIDNELDEGLLSTVFGGLKMLLKKDWANIKCKNPTVLEYLKEIDKSLAGYTMTKMSFSNECKNIRQNIADYFNDILDYKLSQIEKIENVDKFIENESDNEKNDNDDSNNVAKILNLKDDNLLDSLKRYKENISNNCKKSSKLREYADQMLNSVVVFVNDIVIKELEKRGVDEQKLNKKRKENEEYQKKLEKIRDKMNELAKNANEEDIKKLSKERDDAMRKIGVKPIGAMSGDKSIETISKQFKDMMKEFNDSSLNESTELPKGLTDILKSDTYIGIQKSFEKINFSEENDESIKNKLLLRIILNKMNNVFGIIYKNKDMFKGVPSASVQAMIIGIFNALIYGFVGGKFDIDDDRLSILAKCAIESDATIGFNLPLIEPDKPENGNFFVSIMNQFKSDNISSKEVDDAIKTITKKEVKTIATNEYNIKNVNNFSKKFSADIMKFFRQNMTELFDKIIEKANEIKETKSK